MNSIYDEITTEAKAIVDSARLLSGNDPKLFALHVKYFCDSPIVLKEINRILKMQKCM